MGINVGSLFASLTLQSAQFTTGIKKAEADTKHAEHSIRESFEHIGEGAKLMGAALGLGVAFGAEAMIEGAKRSLEFAANMGIAAQKIGVTIQQYQFLRREALESGVATEALDKGFMKLEKSLGDAQ